MTTACVPPLLAETRLDLQATNKEKVLLAIVQALDSGNRCSGIRAHEDDASMIGFMKKKKRRAYLVLLQRLLEGKHVDSGKHNSWDQLNASPNAAARLN